VSIVAFRQPRTETTGAVLAPHTPCASLPSPQDVSLFWPAPPPPAGGSRAQQCVPACLGQCANVWDKCATRGVPYHVCSPRRRDGTSLPPPCGGPHPFVVTAPPGLCLGRAAPCGGQTPLLIPSLGQACHKCATRGVPYYVRICSPRCCDGIPWPSGGACPATSTLISFCRPRPCLGLYPTARCIAGAAAPRTATGETHTGLRPCTKCARACRTGASLRLRMPDWLEPVCALCFFLFPSATTCVKAAGHVRTTPFEKDPGEQPLGRMRCPCPGASLPWPPAGSHTAAAQALTLHTPAHFHR
jgi:hypothetical protein